MAGSPPQGADQSEAHGHGHAPLRYVFEASQLFIFIRPMKSRLPSGTPLVRRMS
mgnify:CR=1 FL=1